MQIDHSTRLLTVAAAALVCVLTVAARGQNAPSSGSGHAPEASMLVYFGTYTGPTSRGIYVSRLNLESGVLTPPQLAAETKSPSFLAARPQGDVLYAVSEIDRFAGKPAGSVSAFRINRETGALTPLNEQTSGGPGPAHLAVDRTGTNVLVANYGGGSIEVLPVDRDGKLKAPTAFVQHTGSSVDPQRQKEPHAHYINVDPANRFAYVADLGLDKVLIYGFDAAKGTLTPNDPPSASVKPGSGPRHIAMDPKGRFAYLINEMSCTITVFSRDPERGGLKELQTISTLPDGQAVLPSYSTAEILVHPSGKFVYGSNRGHDSIVVFAVNETSGRLSHVQHQSTLGSIPRGFGIDPSGAYLLAGNQKSDSVAVFRIDQKSGRLTPTGSPVKVGAPVSVEFVAPK
jgi:6-phosphogluconolactonase